MKNFSQKVKKRNLDFKDKTITKICEELPAQYNPYLARSCRCHGYDLIELLEKRTFVDVFFLLFNGELPTPEQANLLETLMIAYINPGPRHPGTRATMNAAVSRTRSENLLPIGLSVLGGDFLGGTEVSSSMKFIRRNIKNDPNQIASTLLNTSNKPTKGDWHIAPGFGTRCGDIDPMPQKVASILIGRPGSGNALKWCANFVDSFLSEKIGWLSTGVIAAALCDLGFHHRSGAGLFQLINAPGLLAHGLELSNKPITAMPFIDEDHYIISDNAKKN